MDINEESIALHERTGGKLAVQSRVALASQHDLSLAYTPGVAGVCLEIHNDPLRAYPLTMKGNSVAVVSNGTAVLGLGNIGPEAALPVMEGKAILFKAFADIDAIPIVVDDRSVEGMVATVKAIAPTFGGINLEDIAAPACFEIENRLQDIGIPVFHDDQHGTAIVLVAAFTNACRVVGKKPENCTVVISGGGAAGTAIAKLLRCVGHDADRCVPVHEVLVCDSKGIISPDRTDLSEVKKEFLKFTNRDGRTGSLQDALKGADAFIGVSVGGLLDKDDIRSMADDAIVLAMANPTPEIMPDVAKEAGAAVVGTGRSDFPNQVNNLLAFPGIFRGALDAKAARITDPMKIAAAHALAAMIPDPTADYILPAPMDDRVVPAVAKAIADAAQDEGVAS